MLPGVIRKFRASDRHCDGQPGRYNGLDARFLWRSGNGDGFRPELLLRAREFARN
jgi:hypothetical protein